MPVVLGTDAGLYTYHDGEISPGAPALTDHNIAQVEGTSDRPGVIAATDNGVYRITDNGTSSEELGLQGETVVAVHQSPTGRLYAGTRPAHVYTAEDGDTWRKLEGFETIPGKAEWTQNYMGPAQVRAIQSHTHSPSKLFVAVETAGVYVTLDAGATWEYRSRGLDNDPHDLQLLGPDTLIATCGRGLYRTDDAGRVWYRLDTHHDQFWYQYYRSGILHNGTYYTCGMDRATHRYQDDNPGVILRSVDGGHTLSATGYPNDDTDYLNAWTADTDTVYAGTVDGQLLAGPDDWRTVATVDTTIRTLSHVPEAATHHQ